MLVFTRRQAKCLMLRHTYVIERPVRVCNRQTERHLRLRCRASTDRLQEKKKKSTEANIMSLSLSSSLI